MAVYNCSCLARDLGKLFEVYWALGSPNATIPSPWPANFSTPYNKEAPLGLQLNGTQAGVYLSVSWHRAPQAGTCSAGVGSKVLSAGCPGSPPRSFPPLPLKAAHHSCAKLGAGSWGVAPIQRQGLRRQGGLPACSKTQAFGLTPFSWLHPVELQKWGGCL